MKYPDEALALADLGPAQRAGGHIQGELLRAVEKLRDEAQRNGNLNWNDGHQALIAYLHDTLLGSALLD